MPLSSSIKDLTRTDLSAQDRDSLELLRKHSGWKVLMDKVWQPGYMALLSQMGQVSGDKTEQTLLKLRYRSEGFISATEALDRALENSEKGKKQKADRPILSYLGAR